MRVLTPVPPSFLKYSRVFEMELPVWGILDYAAGGDEDEWKSGVGTGAVSTMGQRRWYRCAAKTCEKKSDAQGADMTQNFSPL